MVAENVEGREPVSRECPVQPRLQGQRRGIAARPDWHPSGAQIPVSDVAKISFSRGPSMIRDEDGALTGYVYIDLNTKRLRWLRHAGKQFCSSKTKLTSRLYVQMVRRVRIRAPGQRAAATHSAYRGFAHLSVALCRVSFRRRSGLSHFPRRSMR